MKKKPPFNQEMAIRGVNRRLFARSPVVREKLDESRQEFPRFKKDGTRAKKNWVKRQCEVCEEWVSSAHIAVDHIDPVVPPEGFPDNFDMWARISLFLRRLWCDKVNLQRICDDCHQKKTNAERFARQFKKDLDLVLSLETELDCWELDKAKKSLAKFTPKKLLAYPQDFAERVVRLKETFRGTKRKSNS